MTNPCDLNLQIKHNERRNILVLMSISFQLPVSHSCPCDDKNSNFMHCICVYIVEFAIAATFSSPQLSLQIGRKHKLKFMRIWGQFLMYTFSCADCKDQNLIFSLTKCWKNFIHMSDSSSSHLQRYSRSFKNWLCSAVSSRLSSWLSSVWSRLLRMIQVMNQDSLTSPSRLT